MQFFVIGTDHRVQAGEAGFEGLLRALLAQDYLEPLKAIGEEWDESLGNSPAKRLSIEFHLQWYNIDMTSSEKHKAGILNEQRSRPVSSNRLAYRVPSDEVREEAWVAKLSNSDSGTILVICGYVHFDSLVTRLRTRGDVVDQRVYLETVPEIKNLDMIRSS